MAVAFMLPNALPPDVVVGMAVSGHLFCKSGMKSSSFRHFRTRVVLAAFPPKKGNKSRRLASFGIGHAPSRSPDRARPIPSLLLPPLAQLTLRGRCLCCGADLAGSQGGARRRRLRRRLSPSRLRSCNLCPSLCNVLQYLVATCAQFARNLRAVCNG